MRDEKDFEGLQLNKATENSLLKQRFLRPVDTLNELKRLLWQELALSKLIAGWIPAIPVYEQKLRLGRQCYMHNRNVKCLYERASELPGGIHYNDWMSDLTREALNGFSVLQTNMLLWSATSSC